MNVGRRNWHSINCPGNGLTVMQVVYRDKWLEILAQVMMKVPKAAYIGLQLILNLPNKRKQGKEAAVARNNGRKKLSEL